MSRRPHPYFSRINRLDALRPAGPGRGRRVQPAVAPEAEPGILWDPFRPPVDGAREAD